MKSNNCYISSQNLSSTSGSQTGNCLSQSTGYTYPAGTTECDSRTSGTTYTSSYQTKYDKNCSSFIGQGQLALDIRPRDCSYDQSQTSQSASQSQTQGCYQSQTESCRQSDFGSFTDMGSHCKSSDSSWNVSPEYCKPCGNGPCSLDPNCHMFKSPCPKSKLPDLFPSPFRLKTVSKPGWLTTCGKVLRFYGFYQESIPESGNENYRVHQCEIRFYLDDSTIEVYEPKTFDPGFRQGKLIRRNRIPLPAPANESFYELGDINVGCEVTFYGKTFLISGCDDPTRKHLNRLGKAIPHNIEMPDDPYTVWRQDRINSLFSRKAQLNLDQGKFKKFLLNNSKVLRFWAYWDNRSYEGNLRRFILHFFLEDDTVEIKEITDPQGGIRGAVTFLGKSKLLKNFKDLVPVAGIKEEALLVLNTPGFSSGFMETSYLADRLCPGIDEKEFVTDKDLAIGAVVNVYGRPFILTDCDKATQVYYREKYGIEDFTPLELTPEEVGKPVPKMEVPPHIGIGDEVDTALNWDKLEPKQPKRDELALITKEKDILGFEAKFVKPLQKVNGDRRFVIKIYMVDNTMQIFEKAHPNTGMKEGTFLSRSKVRKNGMGMTPRYELGENSEYYELPDYYVGNILNCNGFVFLLTSADEFTFTYMEANHEYFPQSNLCQILDKIREAVGYLLQEELLSIFSAKDTRLMGVIDPNEFRLILIYLTKTSLNEHELTTINRAFRVENPQPLPDMRTLQAVIQTELQRHRYDRYSLQRVEYTMRYHDPCKTGLLDRDTVRCTLMGAKLPIPKELTDFLVDNFEPADDCNRVDYGYLMRFIDWCGNPAPIKANPTSIQCTLKHLQAKRPSKIFCINYRAFLDQICPNLKCSLPSLGCPSEGQQCQPQRPQMSCPADLSEQEERYLAGQVISDNQVTPKRFRCLEEDQRAQGDCCIDPGAKTGRNVIWTSRDFENTDPRLAEAYSPPPDHEDSCIPAEAGHKELYRPGDFIGWEDFYR